MGDINKYESKYIFVQFRSNFPKQPITIITGESDFEVYVSEHIQDHMVFIRGCVFTRSFDLNVLKKYNSIISKADFEYCLFEGDVCIMNVDITFELCMSEICFNSWLSITSAHFKMLFKVKQAIFKEKLIIFGSTFDNSVLLNTVVANSIQIIKSDFNKELSCRAFENVHSLGMRELNAKNLTFHTFIKMHVYLRNIAISDFFRCYNLDLEFLFMNGLAIYKGYLLAENLYVEQITRETSRIIKHEAYRANNQILAMEYKVREMEEYRKEKKHWRSAGTYFLLWLNKWSNYYGKRWWQGVIFTVLCWILFYGLFVVLRDIVGNQPVLSSTEYIKESVNYLWLLNGLSGLLEDTDNTCWWVAIILVVVFVIGKILIGYGIYQTVAAFRRLSK